MPHQTRPRTRRSSVPLLEIALRALLVTCRSKVEVDNDNLTRLILLGVSRYLTQQQELLRRRVRHGDEASSAKGYAHVIRIPRLAEVEGVLDLTGELFIIDKDKDAALIAEFVLVRAFRNHLPGDASVGAEERVAVVVSAQALANGSDTHDKPWGR